MEAGSFVFETQDESGTVQPQRPVIVEEEPALTTETAVFKVAWCLNKSASKFWVVLYNIV